MDFYTFIWKIAKPIFIFQMARGKTYHGTVNQLNAQKTLMQSAETEIDNLVKERARELGMTDAA